MKKPRDCREIIRWYLEKYGYDGLVNGEGDLPGNFGQCHCDLSEFAPCGDPGLNCHPAYDHGPRNGNYFWMSTEKPRKKRGKK